MTIQWQTIFVATCDSEPEAAALVEPFERLGSLTMPDGSMMTICSDSRRIIRRGRTVAMQIPVPALPACGCDCDDNVTITWECS